MLNFLKVLFMVSLFFLSSCSAPQPKNKWQYDAVSMTKAYQKHFLQGNIPRANSDLRHAKKLSKQSADLKTLIDVELTQCAMQVSILEFQDCENASALLHVQANDKQKAYLHLLDATLQEKDIVSLPNQYQDFATALIKKDTELINEALKEITPLSSKLISASLCTRYISKQNISALIKELSFSGYKKPLIAWLKVLASKQTNKTEKIKTLAKIDVLLSL